MVLNWEKLKKLWEKKCFDEMHVLDWVVEARRWDVEHKKASEGQQNNSGDVQCEGGEGCDLEKEWGTVLAAGSRPRVQDPLHGRRMHYEKVVYDAVVQVMLDMLLIESQQRVWRHWWWLGTYCSIFLMLVNCYFWLESWIVDLIIIFLILYFSQHFQRLPLYASLIIFYFYDVQNIMSCVLKFLH